MSAWGQDSLTVNVSTPVVQGSKFIASYTESVSSYSHEISAEVGFDTASIELVVEDSAISEWLDHGLGRHINVLDAGGQVAWQGIVNSLEVRQGVRSISFGPLTEIANRIAILFSELDPTADPPTTGIRTITTYAEDSASQDAYGIWELVKNGGNLTRTQARQVRDAELLKRAAPQRTKDLSPGGSQPSIVLNCRGYGIWLQSFTYNQSENISNTVSGKVLEVLAEEAAINGVLSTDYGLIGDNDVLITAYEDDYRRGIDIIKDAVKFGDENYDRWLFGVYEDRQAQLNIVPDSIRYDNRTGDRDLLEYHGGGEVMPWTVRPGVWMAWPDLIPGGPLPHTRAELYDDVRCVLIERVTFTAPYDLSVNGLRVNTGAQALAQLGVGA